VLVLFGAAILELPDMEGKEKIRRFSFHVFSLPDLEINHLGAPVHLHGSRCLPSQVAFKARITCKMQVIIGAYHDSCLASSGEARSSVGAAP
jgi:hypothetical protein